MDCPGVVPLVKPGYIYLNPRNPITLSLEIILLDFVNMSSGTFYVAFGGEQH